MIEPFTIAVPESVLEDLRQRLARTRFPHQIAGSGWSYGTDAGFLRELCAYWADGYDWRAREAELNQWPNYRAESEGLKLHFIHAPSPYQHALPLMLTHGWPDSCYLFHRIIGPLTEPERFGGDPADAFHVVCPSMPGYGWSDPPDEPGWDIRKVATALSGLMPQLGYDRYGVQGGDWGSLASAYTAIVDPDRVCGVHLNMVASSGSDDPEECAARGVVPGGPAMTPDYVQEMGYAQIQCTLPDQLACALNDSPAGLAGWMLHGYYAWSDHAGDLEAAISRDELLTNIMIYWVTGSMPSAMRLYRESMATGRFGPPDEFVAAPTGVAMFKDILRPTREWASRHYNILHWREYDEGGHFAAVERPEVLVADIREFFRGLRRENGVAVKGRQAT